MRRRYRRVGSKTVAGVKTARYVYEVQLSEKERIIVTMLVLGVERKIIAHALRVLPETIKTHISRMGRQLQMHSLALLTRWVMTEKGAMKGEWCSPNLHPVGCLCRAHICRAMRYSGNISKIVAVLPLRDRSLIIVADPKLVD
jgi:DNA-binding CsgD family transcriptional regulator